MKTSYALFLSFLGLIFFSGCQSKTEKILRAYVATSNELSSALAGVRDRSSAEASLELINQKFDAYFAVCKRYPEVDPHAMAMPGTVQQLTADIRSAAERLPKEYLRLRKIRGLPSEFWKTITLRNLEGLEVVRAIDGKFGGALPASLWDFASESRILIEQCGFEHVVRLEIDKLRLDQREPLFEKLKKVAPGAKLYHLEKDFTAEIIVGPVADFPAFVAAIDFGKVTFEDEPQRAITIDIAYGSLTESNGETAADGALSAQERLALLSEKSKLDRERLEKKRAAERAAYEKAHREPDPKDPDYYEQLVKQIVSDGNFHKKAIEVLLQTEPSQVPSEETRKAIARTFKQIAESDTSIDREAGIKGLVIWGGKFSVPILLKLLDQDRFSRAEKIITALGELKDARAAPALVARLDDWILRRSAYSALSAMGSAAEDALLEAARLSPKIEVCLPSIELLGEVGTEKSFPFLLEAQKVKDAQIRAVAHLAAQKITRRTRGAKSTPKEP